MAATTLNVLDNLSISTLIQWNDVNRVRKITKENLFTDIVDQLNINVAQGSKSIDTLIYRETFIGDDELVAEVLSTAVVGGNLVLDLVPQGGNPVEFFREGNKVFGNTPQIHGVVVSSTAGQIVVQPYAGSTIAQITADMPVGANIQTLGLVKDYRRSSGVPAVNYFPDVQSNYLTLMRDGAEWDRVDLHRSRIDPVDGTTYWQNVNMKRAVYRFVKDIDRNGFWSQPMAPIANRSENGGVDWCIRNRGGFVQSFAALPPQGLFQDWLDNVMDSKPGMVRSKKVLMGRKLYAHIMNNFTTGYIREIDPMAVRSGSINENMRMYEVGGHTVELVTNLSMFQERDWYNAPTAGTGMTGMKKEWSAYIIDTDPVMTEEGGEVPAIEKLHWGKSPYYITRTSGIDQCPVGVIDKDSNIDFEALKISFSQEDHTQVGLMYHGGWNMPTGRYSGIFEAAI